MQNELRILCVGDVFGRPGRECLLARLPELRERHRVDFIVVNIENAAGGRGITPPILAELEGAPIDVMTTGNHAFELDEGGLCFARETLLRPLNLEGQALGRGWVVAKTRAGIPVVVVSLQGTVFMEGKGPKAINPFPIIREWLPRLRAESSIILVDMHAEATSEKRAMGLFLDGQVSAVFGTHTHVQTADEEIFPNGTAYITDIGMTGPHDSVVGLDPEVGIHRFVTGDKKSFKVAKGGVRLEGVLLTIDLTHGKALSIQRIREGE